MGVDDYKDQGIFNPIAMNEKDFQYSVPLSSAINENGFGVRNSIPAHEEDIYDELEKAIALSRQDQDAISSNGVVIDNNLNDEEMLQKVLKLSREENEKVVNSTAFDKHQDQELEDALRRSYEEALAIGNGSSNICDKEKARMGEVLDLVD